MNKNYILFFLFLKTASTLLAQISPNFSYKIKYNFWATNWHTPSVFYAHFLDPDLFPSKSCVTCTFEAQTGAFTCAHPQVKNSAHNNYEFKKYNLWHFLGASNEAVQLPNSAAIVQKNGDSIIVFKHNIERTDESYLLLLNATNKEKIYLENKNGDFVLDSLGEPILKAFSSFYDTLVWAILDTNVIHPQPFMFGIFNNFNYEEEFFYNFFNKIIINNSLRCKEYEIQFMGLKDSEIISDKILHFKIRKKKNKLLNQQICYEQDIYLHKDYLFLLKNEVFICDCASGEKIIQTPVQKIFAESVILEFVPNK